MLKRGLAILLVTIIGIVFPFGGLIGEAVSPVRVFLNGNLMHFEAPPVIESGRVLVPMRAIFEALGATVQWFPDGNRIEAIAPGKTIRLEIRNRTADINGEAEKIDVPPQIIRNRTFVPLRFVSQALGAEVNWNSGTRTVTILRSGDSREETTKCPITERVNRIVSSSRSQRDIAYGIFSLIAKNITYLDATRISTVNTPAPGTPKWIELNKPENVLENRAAFYDGYAALFQRMAEIAGLESVIINGYSRTFRERRIPNGYTPIRKHAWNAIKIDGTWELVDTVQGYGNLVQLNNPGDTSIRMTQEYRPFFFMTDPKEMIYINFPSNPQWQLIDTPLTFEEFKAQPVLNNFIFEIDAELVSHKNGIIEVLSSNARDLTIIIRDKTRRNFSFNVITYPEDILVIGLNLQGKTFFKNRSMLHGLSNYSVSRSGDNINIRPGITIPGTYHLQIFAQEFAGFGHASPIIYYKLIVK